MYALHVVMETSVNYIDWRDEVETLIIHTLSWHIVEHEVYQWYYSVVNTDNFISLFFLLPSVASRAMVDF